MAIKYLVIFGLLQVTLVSSLFTPEDSTDFSNEIEIYEETLPTSTMSSPRANSTRRPIVRIKTLHQEQRPKSSASIPILANECTWTKTGTEYKGTKNISDKKKSCIDWSVLEDKLTDDMFPDHNVDAAGNMCRNPAGQETGPYCVVELPDVFETCRIQQCPVTLDTLKLDLVRVLAERMEEKPALHNMKMDIIELAQQAEDLRTDDAKLSGQLAELQSQLFKSSDLLVEMRTNMSQMTEQLTTMSQQLEQCPCSACPIGFKWFAITNSCYKFIDVADTWEKARRACLTVDGRAHPVVINTEDENDFVKGLITSTTNGVWTAGARITPEDGDNISWAWKPQGDEMEAIPFTFTGWAAGQPGDDEAHTCVFICPEGAWVAGDPSWLGFSMCEIEVS